MFFKSSERQYLLDGYTQTVRDKKFNKESREQFYVRYLKFEFPSNTDRKKFTNDPVKFIVDRSFDLTLKDDVEKPDWLGYRTSKELILLDPNERLTLDASRLAEIFGMLIEYAVDVVRRKVRDAINSPTGNLDAVAKNSDPIVLVKLVFESIYGSDKHDYRRNITFEKACKNLTKDFKYGDVVENWYKSNNVPFPALKPESHSN